MCLPPKGIGFFIARDLAKQGFTVLCGCRDLGRGEEAASKLQSEHKVKVTPIQLDLDSVASVKAVAQEVEKTYGGLDVLVNNAGLLVSACV